MTVVVNFLFLALPPLSSAEIRLAVIMSCLAAYAQWECSTEPRCMSGLGHSGLPRVQAKAQIS